MPTPERVQPLKHESTAEGGQDAQDAPFPVVIMPQEDALESAGLYVQDGTYRDFNCLIYRVGNDLWFKDTTNGPHSLTELLANSGITAAQHKTLRQLIHFIDHGPAGGFTSGAFKETLPSGPFPTSVIWWTSAAKTAKIVEKTITWTGSNPTTIQWKMYDTDGTTVLETVTDAISYTGPFENTRTRTIA